MDNLVLHLYSLTLIVAATTLFVAWKADQRLRRFGSTPLQSPPLWAIPLGIVIMVIYCFVLYYLPAFVLTMILKEIFFTVPLDVEVVLLNTPLFETMAQLALLFSLGANFSDLACTYGRRSFWKHMLQYVVIVIPAYFATLGLTWVGAQILSLVIDYRPSPLVPAWRLYNIPTLAPNPTLSFFLLATLFFVYGAICYRVRKRGGRSSGMMAVGYWGRDDYEEYLTALHAHAKTGGVTTATPYEQIQQLVQDTRRHYSLTSDAEAFVWLFLKRILLLSDDAIEEAITHGEGDGGIDAIHIDRKGAQVPDCDYRAVHIVACDYFESKLESRFPVNRARLERLADTWVAIASSRDDTLTLNSAMRRRIVALHRYWEPIQNDVPHQIYLVTNRKRFSIDRVWLEQKMNYFSTHTYHYYGQAELIDRFGLRSD